MHFSPISAQYSPVGPSPLIPSYMHWNFPHLLGSIQKIPPIQQVTFDLALSSHLVTLEAALFSHINYGAQRPRINSEFPAVMIKCSLLSEDLGSELSEPAQQEEIRQKKITWCPQHSFTLLIPLPVHRERRQLSIPELLSWETAELGAVQGRSQVTGGRNVCVGLTHQGVSSLTFRGLCCFPGTVPQKQSGIEVAGSTHSIQARQMKEILWQLGLWNVVTDQMWNIQDHSLVLEYMVASHGQSQGCGLQSPPVHHMIIAILMHLGSLALSTSVLLCFFAHKAQLVRLPWLRALGRCSLFIVHEPGPVLQEESPFRPRQTGFSLALGRQISLTLLPYVVFKGNLCQILCMCTDKDVIRSGQMTLGPEIMFF